MSIWKTFKPFRAQFSLTNGDTSRRRAIKCLKPNQSNFPAKSGKIFLKMWNIWFSIWKSPRGNTENTEQLLEDFGGCYKICWHYKSLSLSGLHLSFASSKSVSIEFRFNISWNINNCFETTATVWLPYCVDLKYINIVAKFI